MGIRLQDCPLCQQDLTEAFSAGGKTFCRCGWSTPGSSLRAESQEDSFRARKLMIISAVLLTLVSGFIYLTSVEGRVFWIKQKVSFGLGGVQELDELSERCLQTRDKVCALQALTASSLYDPSDLDKLLRLGRLQMNMGEFAGAALSYKAYRAKGGEDQDIIYRIGKALALAGERAEAKQYYEKAIQDKDGSLNLSATRGLVRLYIEDNKIADAKHLMQKFKRKTRSPSSYFEDEIKMIQLASSSR